MGWDYSGTIAAVGDNMKGKWEVGDEVFGMCEGPVSSTLLPCSQMSKEISAMLIEIGCSGHFHEVSHHLRQSAYCTETEKLEL